MKSFLHVGCGHNRKAQTTPGFNSDDWREIRFDIDESVAPDLIGTVTDMRAVSSESVDAVFSAHNIEHIYPHEVAAALKEFVRVLVADGFAIITCPDLHAVCAWVAKNGLTEVAYVSPAGPITPLDILYGHRASMERGNLYMAHRGGFTNKTLVAALREAGFVTVGVIESDFALWAVASKKAMDNKELTALAQAQLVQKTIG
jgi:SAM-dependent methyltransferase